MSRAENKCGEEFIRKPTWSGPVPAGRTGAAGPGPGTRDRTTVGSYRHCWVFNIYSEGKYYKPDGIPWVFPEENF